MVFGNLSTGYWLGAAAAAGLHWVELGRKTLTGTSDDILVNGGTETATYSTNFSSNTGWTEVGTGNITIDTSNNRLQFNADHGSDDDAVVYDLGAGNVSDTAWVLRYKFNMSGSNAPAAYMLPMLSSHNVAVTSSTTLDALGMWIGETGGGTGGAYANIRLSDGEDNEGGSYHGNSSSAFSNSTDYYITMKRESATKFTIEIKTGSHNGTHVLGSPITATDIPSSVGGLRYICFRDNDGSSHTRYLNSYIYDLEFYNNMTSVEKDLTVKPYMMVLGHGLQTGGSAAMDLRLNSDTGNNYATRFSDNGGSDSTQTSQNKIYTRTSEVGSVPSFMVGLITNTASEEKLMTGDTVIQNTAGAGNAPSRSEWVGKYANTSDSITSVNTINTGGGDLNTGSEVVVLGYDPDDTEGTSVWEELADVEVSSGSIVNTGTIDAKKYLMIQLYTVPNGTSYSFLRFNSDTGTNYASRYNTNGGGEATGTSSDDGILFYAPLNETVRYMTAFIINKSDKEKLVIGEGIAQNTAGAGNAPERRELYGKWANTSASITSIQVDSKNGSFAAGTRLKVWGFD